MMSRRASLSGFDACVHCCSSSPIAQLLIGATPAQVLRTQVCKAVSSWLRNECAGRSSELRTRPARYTSRGTDDEQREPTRQPANEFSRDTLPSDGRATRDYVLH